MAWLRGGDTTPDEQMEGQFIDIVAQLVAEKLEKNERRSRRRREDLPPSPLSIKSINHGAAAQVIERGERVAQLVIAPYVTAAFQTVESLDDTVRGAGGFGSTGK